MALILSARADDREQAINGQIADIASTAVGLALGASETNPLGVVALGVKALVKSQIEQAPVEDQPALWNLWGAAGWGATANNVCVILSIVTSGGFGGGCLLVGLVAGVTIYQSGPTDQKGLE